MKPLQHFNKSILVLNTKYQIFCGTSMAILASFPVWVILLIATPNLQAQPLQLTLAASDAKSVSRRDRGIHAFFTVPVEIPINRDPHTPEKLFPADTDASYTGTGILTDSGSQTSTQAEEPVNIQFHKQNPVDGTYHFGYDIGTPSGRSYREERRHASGRVVGQYGFMDPDGVMHHFEYEADANGYRLRPRTPSTTTTTTTEATTTTTPTTTTTKPPFRFQFKPVPIVGPIPRTWTQLFGTEEPEDEFSFLRHQTPTTGTNTEGETEAAVTEPTSTTDITEAQDQDEDVQDTTTTTEDAITVAIEDANLDDPVS